MTQLFTPGAIWTTAGYVSPLAKTIDAAAIDIEAIALGLSRIPRYLGQTDPYQPALSVAQHSYNVESMAARLELSRDLQAVALLHDASEAFLNDIIRPLKRDEAFDKYREIEASVQAAVWQKFDLVRAAEEWGALVHGLDNAVMAQEKAGLIPATAGRWPGVPELPRLPMVTLEAAPVEGLFLEAAARLGLIS